MTDLVTVVIPVLNGEEAIDQAIASVLDQTHTRCEIIVVADGARPAVVETLRGLVDQRPDTIRLMVRKEGGVSEAINEALGEARGAWLTLLGANDTYEKSRLAQLVAACHDEGKGWGFTGLSVVDGCGPIRASASDIMKAQSAIRHWPTLGFAWLQNDLAATVGNLFFSHALWDSVGPFSALRGLRAWDYALRLLMQDEPVFLAAPLYRYRVDAEKARVLREVTARETDYVLRRFFLDALIGRHGNPLLPTPSNWPGFFETAVKLLGLGRLLPSAQELRFAGRMSHRAI